jgi:hypothetical protein
MRSSFRYSAVVGLLAVPVCLAAQVPIPRQFPPFVAPPPAPVQRLGTVRANNDDRSGPRLGVAYLVGGSVTAENAGRRVSPLMSLFGWQFEHQFQTDNPSVPVPMTEFVVLGGAIEQGLFLPSASWLIGFRKPNGWEAAVGPMVTGAGIQLAFAAGVTHSMGAINVPINLAVAPGRRGASVSVTTGFNVR